MLTAGRLRAQAVDVARAQAPLRTGDGPRRALFFRVRYRGDLAAEEQPGILCVSTSEVGGYAVFPLEAASAVVDAHVPLPPHGTVRRDACVYLRFFSIVDADKGGAMFTEAGTCCVPHMAFVSGINERVMQLVRPGLGGAVGAPKGVVVLQTAHISAADLGLAPAEPYDLVDAHMKGMRSVVADAVAKVTLQRLAVRDGRLPGLHPEISRVVFDEWRTAVAGLTVPGFEYWAITPGEGVSRAALTTSLNTALAGVGWDHAAFDAAVAAWRNRIAPPTPDMLVALEVAADACTVIARAITYTEDRGYTRGRPPFSTDVYSDATLKLAGDCEDKLHVALRVALAFYVSDDPHHQAIRYILRHYIPVAALMLSNGGRQAHGAARISIDGPFQAGAHVGGLLVPLRTLSAALRRGGRSGALPTDIFPAPPLDDRDDWPVVALEITGHLAGCCAPADSYGEAFVNEVCTPYVELLKAVRAAGVIGWFPPMCRNVAHEQRREESNNGFYMAVTALMIPTAAPAIVDGAFTLRMMRLWTPTPRGPVYGAYIQDVLRGRAFAAVPIDAPAPSYWPIAARWRQHMPPFVEIGAVSPAGRAEFAAVHARMTAEAGHAAYLAPRVPGASCIQFSITHHGTTPGALAWAIARLRESVAGGAVSWTAAQPHDLVVTGALVVRITI
jgi:hypothetical protein